MEEETRLLLEAFRLFSKTVPADMFGTKENKWRTKMLRLLEDNEVPLESLFFEVPLWARHADKEGRAL
jgi:hypothetical protein